jgi:hypothetical protein
MVSQLHEDRLFLFAKSEKILMAAQQGVNSPDRQRRACSANSGIDQPAHSGCQALEI